MFAANNHSLLVPFDGSFDARGAPTAPPKGKDKDDWKKSLEGEVEKLGAAQERLYADGRYAVLIVFQALDAAGKDGTIRHVFTGVNPVGLRVAAFKQPTPLELAHDLGVPVSITESTREIYALAVAGKMASADNQEIALFMEQLLGESMSESSAS